MMLGQERQEQHSADLVIRGTFVALAILTGTGAAFGLWGMLHSSTAPAAVTGAVVTLALGLGLISVAFQNRMIRLFGLLMAASMVVAFFAGAGAFAALSS